MNLLSANLRIVQWIVIPNLRPPTRTSPEIGDGPAGRPAYSPPPGKVSLNILMFRQILRPNESFHTFLLFSPVHLIRCYERMNTNFQLYCGHWQAICYCHCYNPDHLTPKRVLVVMQMEDDCRNYGFGHTRKSGVAPEGDNLTKGHEIF